MRDLFEDVIQWAEDRDLVHEENATKQMVKVMEEVGELSAALLRNKRADIVDSIGDGFITLIILSAQLGLDPIMCLDKAYEEISGRTGETISGTFIKSIETR